jgi:hypothetical protein
MLIKQDILNRIARGEISLAFRQWKRPTVRTGGSLKTSVGVLDILAIDPITDDDVTDADARRAGFDDRQALLTNLCRHRGDQLYRIAFRLAGPDPRIALRNDARLSTDDVGELRQRLERFDDASPAGPWTLAVLNAIAAAPEMKAADLAVLTGFDKEWLKTNIRKLKNLGLTESLSPGYRLSSRGRSLLRRLKRRA